MAPTSVAQPKPSAKVIPIRHALARAQETVDHVAELRDLIRRAQEQERALTRELIETMDARGLRSLPGHRAVAVLEERTTLTVDAGLFLEALGPAALPAITVRVEQARHLMAADDLAAISETATGLVLRVDGLRGVAA